MKRLTGVLLATATPLLLAAADRPALHLGDKGYLTAPGLDVIVFDDIYPDGHQTGVTVIQHGTRWLEMHSYLKPAGGTAQQ